ncbi:DUF4185 domain-containing protein [Athalassotoga saccharophila]|uniref:DUF4185 domain-containing protein n=1 Tax=Athalassotoga saccharophila TaxID=1441386 RepID=UPI001379DB22|nr:DUF4185 domain-containing protein [Athalassotoga saccharophila]BBJ27498.1 hypothetical protein ATHSA_0367 [Athalassotoga saccharophila]
MHEKIFLILVLISIPLFSFSLSIKNTEMVCKLIGIDSINQELCFKEQVYGADLGIMIPASTSTYFIFGDTFGQGMPIWNGPTGTLWRSNVLAVAPNGDFKNGVKFDKFISVNSGNNFIVSSHNLTITAGPYMELGEYVDEVPKVLLDVSHFSTFTVQVKLNYMYPLPTFSGFLIWKNVSNWIAFGITNNRTLKVSGLINNQLPLIISSAYGENFLKIKKEFSSYIFYSSNDGINWKEIGSYNDKQKQLINAKIGLFVENSDNNAFSVSMNFSDFIFDNELLKFNDQTISYDNPVPSYAKEVISSKHGENGEITVIPTGGIYNNNNLYVYYMSVSQWGAPGYWDCNYSGLAVSKDEGNHFEKLPNVTWNGTSNFVQIYPVFANEDPDYISSNEIYLFSIPSGRWGNVYLMKVKSDQIEDKSKYQYFSGLQNDYPIWSYNESDSKSVADGPAGELSIMFDKYLKKWIMTYLDPQTTNIVIRFANDPWGPWSKSKTLVSSYDYPGLYGAFMNPLYTLENGKIIYFTMSMWGPYSVFLMKTDFEN